MKPLIQRFSLIAALAMLLSLPSCTETINNPGEQLPTGTMLGRVWLYDGNRPRSEHSGVTVQLEGTNFTTTTNAFGEWRFDNVPSRTYNVVVSKPDYGLSKLPSVVFIGGGVIRVSEVYMSKIPACPAVFDAMRQYDTLYLEAHGHAPCSDKDSGVFFVSDYLLYVFSNTPDVAYEPGKFKLSMQANSGLPRGTASILVERANLEQYFDLNDSIYVAIYNLGGPNTWIDPLTNVAQYSSMHPERSRVLAFKWSFD